MDYKQSGVDMARADAFVARISQLVPQTHNERVLGDFGGFAAVYKASDDKYLAACTDGVGTKLKWAQQLGAHRGLGIDLVAMCVNDLLCVGATPLFFLDYMAFGQLDTAISEELVLGIVSGCKRSGMALLGGETAEMPGVYAPGEYDLAGFSVGEMHPSQMLTGAGAQDGDVLIGIASSGFHSNGFSLLRKLVGAEETALISELLTPTRIYTRLFAALRQQFAGAILGAAHITGGGIGNIARISNTLDFHISHWPALDELPAAIGQVVRRVKPLDATVFTTFNMGVGLVLLVRQHSADAMLQYLLHAHGERAWRLGHVTPGTGKLVADAALDKVLAG
ncbi:MAG: phosphoribosylformylglycinamidine cyclo-ligase [Ottowia sp.]|nr:phosphoribosylformylglycinamidine cyclo-ligase [Ottowia sp.]